MTDVRVYRRPISTWWWTRKRTYFVFVMRELSSIFIAWFVAYLVMLAYAVGQGVTSYEDFLDWAASPVVVTINVVAFAFMVLHTVTWFSLTTQAMALRVRGRPVPGWLIIGVQYVGLAVVTVFVWWLVTRMNGTSPGASGYNPTRIGLGLLFAGVLVAYVAAFARPLPPSGDKKIPRRCPQYRATPHASTGAPA